MGWLLLIIKSFIIYSEYSCLTEMQKKSSVPWFGQLANFMFFFVMDQFLIRNEDLLDLLIQKPSGIIHQDLGMWFKNRFKSYGH